MQSSQADVILDRLKAAVTYAENEVANVERSLQNVQKDQQEKKSAYEKAHEAVQQAETELKRVQNYESYEALGEEIKELTAQKNDVEKQMKDAQALIDSGSDEGVPSFRPASTRRTGKLPPSPRRSAIWRSRWRMPRRWPTAPVMPPS